MFAVPDTLDPSVIPDPLYDKTNFPLMSLP